ncbi:hypothetical protein V5799_025045 [Amblyomma americanum]|uniref:DDE Tnp4 domain-containing protein n=1 Tax=Amblyomma americanum TaxID=6943 RepID=A0AAQ4EAS2_AMBAM
MDARKRHLAALVVLLRELEEEESFYPVAKRSRRLEESAQKRILKERLDSDPEEYRNLLRVSREQFLHLLARVRARIEKEYAATGARRPVNAETRLQVTLRYLTSGESPEFLSEQFRVARTRVRDIIHKTCVIIFEELKKDFMKLPRTDEDWKEVMRLFGDKCNFPNCIGAIGGKHVTIKKPARASILYMNHKKTFSVILLAAVDANGKFIYIEAGVPGGEESGELWQKAALPKAIEDKRTRLPRLVEVASSPNVLLPPTFVTDSALPLQKHVVKPFAGTSLSEDKVVFNYRLSKAWLVMETAFKQLEDRFRCLRTVIQEQPEKAVAMVTASCALHNFLGNSVPCVPDANFDEASSPFFGLRTSCETGSSDAIAARDDLCAFLNGQGAVPLQREFGRAVVKYSREP